MTAVPSFKELLDHNVFNVKREFELLKSAAIYGANGSGKSNFMWAMNTMVNIVNNSFRYSLSKEKDRPDQKYQFRLSSATEHDDTMFEVSFMMDGEIYRYGFEINGYEIKREWLYRKKQREVRLFMREENNQFEINKAAFSEGVKFEKEVNENVLFVSHLAQHNQKISKRINNWFKDINVISGIYENQYDHFTLMLLEEDDNFKQWASLALKFLEITNMEMGEGEGEILTYHNKYDENDLFIGSIPFKASDESEGTKKLIHLLGPIYDTLRKGKILFIDEFDSKLHSNLSRKLLDLFHEFNTNNAQIVFTALDVTLMDRDLFRRDQLWFIEKDQFGVSELYSLSDFSAKVVRNTSAFDKKYLNNEFGAADALEISDEMKTLLYAE